jgi:hypothetical protein
MSKLKNYEIDAITSKVLALIKEENKKNQPVFTKETEERMKLKNKLNKAEEEIRVLKAKMYKMDNEIRVKYDNQDIHFSDTEYTVHDNSWRNTIPVRQEIILSQIKSDNLDEIIEKIVKQFVR